MGVAILNFPAGNIDLATDWSRQQSFTDHTRPDSYGNCPRSASVRGAGGLNSVLRRMDPRMLTRRTTPSSTRKTHRHLQPQSHIQGYAFCICRFGQQTVRFPEMSYMMTLCSPMLKNLGRQWMNHWNWQSSGGWSLLQSLPKDFAAVASPETSLTRSLTRSLLDCQLHRVPRRWRIPRPWAQSGLSLRSLQTDPES